MPIDPDIREPELYFLLVYHLRDRRVDVHDFGDDFAGAAAEYRMLEDRHREERDIEVVLLGADSRETIERTHAHYFARSADVLLEQFLEPA